MKCEECGHQNRPGAHFCQQCGRQLPVSESTPELAAPATPAAVMTSDNDPTITQPLPQLQTTFAPLPKGAVVGDRYTIQDVVSSANHNIHYIAQNTDPLWLCPNCEMVVEELDEQFCAACGADMSASRPLHIHYRLEETTDPQAFAGELQLLSMRLTHPGIRLAVEIFSETPYGPQRHYRVLSHSSAIRADTVPIPQELHTALKWSSDLAKALVYLHQHQVVLGTPDLEHVLIEDKDAYWANLHQARIISPESRGRVQSLLAQDVQGLATLLLHLATGEDQLTPDLPLPDSIHTLLTQAFNGRLMAPEFSAQLERALEQLRRPDSVLLVVGQKTDVGQVRTLNEDSLLVLQFTPIYRSKSQPIGLFVVADGMGGHDAGDVASHLTCNVIGQEAVTQLIAPATQGQPRPEPATWLTAVTQTANRRVYEERKAAKSDMGTTLTMALFDGDRATIASVGDSRAYHLTPESITQISVDHSLVQRLVDTGQISPEEALTHPQKNVIYRVMGDTAKAEVDTFEQRLQVGEALLLCSDGLSGMVTDDRIWHIWQTSYSPQEACERLVEEANRAGGEDNITVIVVQISHS